jgi:hypothetical protein
MAMELQRAVGRVRGESPTLIALISEMIALRRQIAVLKRSGTHRPCFPVRDRLFLAFPGAMVAGVARKPGDRQPANGTSQGRFPLDRWFLEPRLARDPGGVGR